jgi:uncharacterized protein YndB with AHSA1/START domain
VNETLSTTGGRPTLRIERRLGHAPELVWRALTEPKELSQWYPFQAAEMDLRVGGTIGFEDEEGGRYDATITELEPRRVLAFRVPEPGVPGGRETDNRLRFELRPDPDGCLLILTHVFDDRAAAASYAAGWQGCLDGMETLLAGDPVDPLDPATMIARHETFVRQFGLDRATVDTTSGGWTLRFERQLMMRDIDTVRSALPAPTPGVRWDLSQGPGGARIHLTVTGNGDQNPETAGTTWRSRLESLVAQLPAG